MILMQNDIWKETVAPIACSGCVLNDLATTRNRFVDVVPVWLGLLAAPEVQPLMSEAAVDCAAWDESLRAAAEACRIVDALCSCVAVFDVSNSQSVSWVHVDANGLFGRRLPAYGPPTSLLRAFFAGLRLSPALSFRAAVLVQIHVLVAQLPSVCASQGLRHG